MNQGASSVKKPGHESFGYGKKVKNQYGFKYDYVVINGFWGMIGNFRDFRDIVPFQVQPHNDVFKRDAASRIKDGARSWYDEVVFVL